MLLRGSKTITLTEAVLLEHVLSLMEVATLIAPRYEDLDADKLLIGAFLHDIGKIRELTYEPDLGYSTQGQLLGHLGSRRDDAGRDDLVQS